MKKTLLIISAIIFIFSCKHEPKHKVAPSHEVGKDLNLTKETVTVEFSSPEAAQLYKDYLILKAALVNSNVEETRRIASELSKKLKGREEKAYNTIHTVSGLIAKSKDLKKQREFFVGLSQGTAGVLKTKISSGKIYEQFCPMAFDGRGGYWLSNSDEVRNPYFGDEMLACGAVTKEFQ